MKLCNVLVTVQFAKTKAVLDIYDNGQYFRQTSDLMWKSRITGKYYFLFFINILLALTKCSIWQEELALVYNSIKFWDFPEVSRPEKRVAYTICITDNDAPFHMWQRKNLVKYQKVWKYNDHDCSIKVSLYEMTQVTEQGKT